MFESKADKDNQRSRILLRKNWVEIGLAKEDKKYFYKTSDSRVKSRE